MQRRQFNEVGLIREVAEDALVVDGRFLGVALFAMAFAEAESRGGGELAVGVELLEDDLVGLDGGGKIAVGLFFKQPVAEVFAEVLRFGRKGG